MTIRKFDDPNSSDVIIKSSLRSSGDVTSPLVGPAGTINGTVSFSDTGAGMDTSGGGSAQWSNFTGNLLLTDAGQISVTVTTRAIAKLDSSADVSMSTGYARSANAYLWSSKTQGNASSARCFMNANEDINTRIDLAANFAAQMTSVGKGQTAVVTVGWDADDEFLFINGAEIARNARTAGFASDMFYNLMIGAQFNGTGDVLAAGMTEEVWQTDLVVSTLTPAPIVIEAAGLSFFGDSFPNRAIGVVISPFFDAKSQYSLPQQIWLATGKINVVDGSAFSGATICDTGVNDLDDEIDGFISTFTQPNVAIIAGNNDTQTGVASDAQVDNGTTGTAARLESWLDKLLIDGRKRVYIATPGSKIYDTTLDTALNKTRTSRVEGIIRDVVSQWIQANGTAMEVRVMPLQAIMGGEYIENFNYQGFVNTIGNITVAGVANADDIHPSPEGWTGVNAWSYQALAVPIAGKSGSVFLTGPLTSNLTG